MRPKSTVIDSYMLREDSQGSLTKVHTPPPHLFICVLNPIQYTGL